MALRMVGIAASVMVLAGWTGTTGQAPQSVKYTARMTGASETPTNTEKGTGTATLTVAGGQLKYSITVKGLTGPATAAHIHVGAKGVAGPPVYTFVVKPVASGMVAEGSIDLTKDVSPGISGDSLKALLGNGNAYVNVHTAAHVPGEIRGQVSK